MKSLLFMVLSLSLYATSAHALTPRQWLEALVAIDTSNPPGDEDKAVRFIVDELRKEGLEVTKREFRGGAEEEGAKDSFVVVPFGPGRSSLVARLSAAHPTKKPLLLLAHLDVVGAKSQPWTTPPFTLTEKDGFLYGRGVNDDKGWAAIALSVFLDLRRAHAQLDRDIILALTGDEESGGEGVRLILEKRPELLNDAELALNEGGTTFLGKDNKPHVSLMQSAEKTYQTFRLVARGPGGHSSLPQDDNAIYRIANALQKLSAYHFAPRLTPTIRQGLVGRAALESADRAAVLIALSKRASLDSLSAAEQRVLAEPLIRSMVHTTCVATMIEGGTRENALPVRATATVNCRLVPSDSVAQVEQILRDVVADPQIEISEVTEMGMGPESPIDGPVRDALEHTAKKLWGDQMAVTASLGTGATDSRFLRKRGIKAYGIGILPMRPADVVRPHGPDERIPTTALKSGYDLLKGMVEELAR